MTWHWRPPPQQRRATTPCWIDRICECDSFAVFEQSGGVKRVLTALAQILILKCLAQRSCLTLCRRETTLLNVIAAHRPIGWRRLLLRSGRPPLRSDIRQRMRGADDIGRLQGAPEKHLSSRLSCTSAHLRVWLGATRSLPPDGRGDASSSCPYWESPLFGFCRLSVDLISYLQLRVNCILN